MPNTQTPPFVSVSGCTKIIYLPAGIKIYYGLDLSQFTDPFLGAYYAITSDGTDEGTLDSLYVYNGSVFVKILEPTDNNVKLASDYNTLGLSAGQSQEDFNQAVASQLDGKLDKPTMTDNYYGLWDDTNKKFTNGNIRRGVNYNGREPLLINTDDNYNYWNDLQIGRLYDPTGNEFPDNRFLGFGFSDDFGNDNNLFIYVSGGYEPGMYPDNDPKSFYGMFTLNRDNLSLGNGSPEYGSNARIVTSTTTTKGTLRLEASHEINFVTSEYGSPKLLNYVKDNNYWEFFKPIKGGNIKDGLRFTLPTSITPTPNTLVPKTDGSRPIWYNNSSVANDLAFKSEIFSLNLYKEYSTPPSTPPKASGLNSVAIGDGTEANSTSMFVFGYEAGKGTINAEYTFIFGYYSGRNAHYSSRSIFIGGYTGQNSMSAYNSIFLGDNAGSNASNSSHSIFIGTNAGASLDSSPYSVLIGYNAGRNYTNKIGSNNIIIGTNISLPSATTNALNIGGIIYGINTYSTKTGEPSTTPSSNGMIGIGVVTPTEKLEVNGNVKADKFIQNYKPLDSSFSSIEFVNPTTNEKALGVLTEFSTTINTIGVTNSINNSTAYVYANNAHSYCKKNTVGNGIINTIRFYSSLAVSNKRIVLIRGNAIINTITVNLIVGLNTFTVNWDTQLNDYVGIDSSFAFAYRTPDGIGFTDMDMTSFSVANYPGTIPLSFDISITSRYISDNNIFKNKKLLLYGDSRVSTDYPFTKTILENRLSLSECYNGGFSGYTTAQLATNTCLNRILSYDADFICILLGGNDNGASGSIGTFSTSSELYALGETVVSETNINLDYSGTKFIQAVSHIIRKLDAYYYDFRSRASLTGSETETEKDNKIESVKKPLIFICTDIPQKRNNSSDEFSKQINWERKRLAIIEACEKYNFPYYDLYTEVIKNIKFSLEPYWVSPTNTSNNQGIYTMDGLHLNKYGFRFISTLIAEKFKEIGNPN